MSDLGDMVRWDMAPGASVHRVETEDDTARKGADREPAATRELEDA